jgi:signal transduction histidine kinase
VAHEIRNPLTAISATLQVIGNSLPSDDRRRGIIDKVNGQVLRLDRLVTDLLSYARPPEPRMAVQGLEAVAREAVGQVAAPATVRTDTDALVYCDAHYVQQVLVNLVQNAADAAGPGGRVEIQVGPGAELRVADDGPGIAPDARDRLFEAFFTTKPRGTGLGLAISRKLCESMGGSLELMAGGGLGPDGRGACFRLTLPAASDHASPSDSGGRSD